LDAALVAIHPQVQLIDMAGGPAAGMDHAKRAAGEGRRHDETVIGIEKIFADAVAIGLGESAQATIHVLDISGRAEGDEIENMDADITENTVGAVALGQPPEPLLAGAPVAPGFRNEPALQVGCLDMLYRADAAAEHQLAGGMDLRH